MQPLRVLFLCIGNSCRSQMAEGFGRSYGSDVMASHSAGLFPAASVARGTVATMKKKNIDVSSHVPKGILTAGPAPFDLVLNMSGSPVPPGLGRRVMDWAVPDPIGASEEVYMAVADQIERLVMDLVLELRAKAKKSPPPPPRKSNSRLHRGG